MNAMAPVPYRVTQRHSESADTVTMELEPCGDWLLDWVPGQFTMAYVFGIGEVPLSVSGGVGGRSIRHTVKAVGAVTRALHDVTVGTVLGLRGPYGRGWPGPRPGSDVLLVAGGIGLAPLRPLVWQVLGDRFHYGKVAVLIGARTPADLVFVDEFEQWRAAGAEVLVTVDRADSGWAGYEGLVTDLLDEVIFAPMATMGYLCGPEMMMRAVGGALRERGVPAHRIQVSMERNMQCGVATCGHCQLGPVLVCRDGPVFGYDRVGPLMEVKQL